jgi:hypothetical protein
MGPTLAGTFEGADLRRATLYCVDRESCNPIRPADLGRVTYDRFTRWPAGFDPRAHGAQLVE